MDVNGKVLYETMPKVYKAEISTGNFSSGVYFIQIQINGNRITQKLVVNK